MNDELRRNGTQTPFGMAEELVGRLPRTLESLTILWDCLKLIPGFDEDLLGGEGVEDGDQPTEMSYCFYRHYLEPLHYLPGLLEQYRLSRLRSLTI
jgi:hypothetical protein